MNNSRINGFFNSWVPFVKPDRVADEYHYKLNDFLNAWYVDPAALCQNNDTCAKNAGRRVEIKAAAKIAYAQPVPVRAEKKKRRE